MAQSKKWTPAQQAAIDDEGGALLISAAAGSGKTAVLVERAVRLITKEENPVAADRLLIVTFTNAAARELRSRMAARLEEMLRANPRDVVLRKQSLLLRRAFIGTIDAFCQQMVKEQFARLNVPPDIAVGDEALLSTLSGQAIEETMDEMYAVEDFVEFAGLYGQARNDARAAESILQLYNFTRTLPNPDKVMKQFAKQYENQTPIAATPWGQELLAYVQEATDAQITLLKKALELAQEDEALEKYTITLAQDIERETLLQALAAQGDWDAAVQKITEKYPRMPTIRGYEGYNKETIKELRDKAKEIRKDLLKYALVCTEEEYQQDLAMARPMVAALVEATLLYSRKYETKKIEEKTLDFSDFEHLALQLLQDENGERSEFSAQISRRYDVIMVDEYQDTNDLQARLYECLAKPDGSNLFYVGDVKQSVYRFRKANPGLFLRKKEAWAPHGTGEYPAVISLGHNFRSGSGVIGGVNFLFHTLMSKQLGEIEYNQSEELIQGSQGGDEVGFELHLLEDPEGVGEAGYIAEKIAQMMQEKYPVRDGEGVRPCAYGDFCVLLRSRTDMQKYVVAMEEKGIPVVSDVGDDLLVTPEVLPVLAALRVIDNPGDDVSLAATLLGPSFHFTIDEVTELRAQTPTGSLWNAVAHSEKAEIVRFREEISLYRAAASGLSVADLLEELLERTGYLSAVGAMEGGVARHENVLRFVAWAGEVSSSGRGGLANVVRLLESGKGPASADQSGVQGHVKIMTIHKSKGLEYPICFLVDTTRKFNARDLNERVQMNAELGIGLTLRTGNTLYYTLPLLAIRRRAKRETWSEEMRVLYVALTRPKEKMILTACDKNIVKKLRETAVLMAGDKPNTFLLANESSTSKWIMAAALLHPDADPLLQVAGGVVLPRIEANGHFVMQVETLAPKEGTEEEIFALTAAPDEALQKQVEHEFAQCVVRKPLERVPIKVSVSSLSKKGGTPPRKRPGFMYQSGLTGAEKGTVQHEFMQFANLDNAYVNASLELERLVEQGFLEKELAEKVDLAGLQTFFASDLWQRMQKAQEVLRELDFITAIPASRLEETLPPELAKETVLVQGIADVVVLYQDSVEIVDYKTDRGKTPEQLVKSYQKQLQMYQVAIQKKLGLPVQKLTIWSFTLGQEVQVPLAALEDVE